MIRLLAKLHNVDRRWLYLGTVLVLIVPFVVIIPMPPGKASQATRGLYDAIESCPPDKVVWVDSSWDMGSQAENYAQLECVIRHLCKKGVKFVVTSVGVTPFAPTFANQVVGPIAKQAGYQYGRDWVNMGYVQAGGGAGVIINGMCKDFHAIRPSDMHGTPVAELPLMQRVRSIRDIHVVYCVTYSPTPEWISFVQGQHGTPVAFGCMTIMGPSYNTYLDSGQLRGMLVGNRGAAEYEDLVHYPAKGTQLIMAASFGNCMIILAAVLGNLGAWAHRRIEREAE